MAQECQLTGMRPHRDGIYQEALRKFAELVAAQEREECAKLCEETYEYYGPCPMAEAIRARGTT